MITYRKLAWTMDMVENKTLATKVLSVCDLSDLKASSANSVG